MIYNIWILGCLPYCSCRLMFAGSWSVREWLAHFCQPCWLKHHFFIVLLVRGCVQKSSSSGLLKVLSWGVGDNVSAIIIAETISELLLSDLVGSLLFWLSSSLTDPWHHRIVCCHLQKLSATKFKHYPLCFVMLNPQWTRFCYDWWHFTKKLLPNKNLKFSFFNFSHWHYYAWSGVEWRPFYMIIIHMLLSSHGLGNQWNSERIKINPSCVCFAPALGVDFDPLLTQCLL